MNNKKLFNAIVKISLISMVLMMSFQVLPVSAASLTGMSDTMSRLKAATLSDHTIAFTTVTTIPVSGTIVVDFPTGFSTDAALDYTDMDLVIGGGDVLLAAVPGSGAASAWGAVRTDADTITLTNNDTDTFAAGAVEIQVGLNATFTDAGDKQTTNSGAGDNLLMTITTSAGDSGSLAVSIIADDQVVISGTVGSTFTFTVSDNVIGFAALTPANARYATGDAAGSDAEVAAHTMSVATNATDGYAVTYNGATLTSGSDTITVASITGDDDGTPGTEQFGLSISTSGDATIAAGYDNATPADWAWVASTTTTIVSEIVPTATETFSAYYLGNIATTTEPGTYTSTITYIATGTF
ncbi:MAG: hypothetical protein ABII19_02800 [Patescibacteria group bacterium]